MTKLSQARLCDSRA